MTNRDGAFVEFLNGILASHHNFLQKSTCSSYSAFETRHCSVMPAKAGIQFVTSQWIPAFAGMANKKNGVLEFLNGILASLHNFLQKSACSSYLAFETRHRSVMPAKAGIQFVTSQWIPAFAGMANKKMGYLLNL